MKNKYVQRDLFLNLEQMELSAPALGLYTCIKSLKNVHKIRLQRDYFETCNKWPKSQDVSVDIKIVSLGVVCPCPGAIYLY